MRHLPFRRSLLVLAVAGLLPLPTAVVGPAIAQTMINLRDADIRAFIDDVAKVTGSSFIVDPRVQGRVSVVSERPLSRQAYFELFLATLRANGFVAVPVGSGQYRIQPAEAGAGAAQRGGDRFTTAIIPLTNIDAQSAVESIRPLISRNASVAANRAGNALVITDFADNIGRVRTALRQIDQDRAATRVVPLRNAGATELARSLTQLLAPRRGDADVRATAVVVPVEGSNAVAIRGEAGQVARAAQLAEELDRQAVGGLETRVIYLEHADAAAIVPVLQTLVGQAVTQAPPMTPGGGAPDLRRAGPGGQEGTQQAPAQATTPTDLGVAAGQQRRAVIARYEGANAVVISAPRELMRDLGEVVRQLDQRRRQIQVEAIIVEISDTAARQLGVQFLLSGTNRGSIPFFATNYTNAVPNILAVAGAVAAQRGVIDGPLAQAFETAAANALLGPNRPFGATGGYGGGFGSAGVFGFVINAVQSDAASNILSTPSVLTLDNQPARILVGQEIPVTTGEALGQNLENSFRTVQRQDVGIQLAVKPQITAGGNIRLDIKQTVSSIANIVDRDFVLNKREIETSVTVGDGEIIALGGLLDETEQRRLEKVPGLGDIPAIGELFRSRTRQRQKTNLMVFIRPTIIESREQAAELTASRWDGIRNEQEAQSGFAALDALAYQYLRTYPPYRPHPFPPALPGSEMP
ncbi:MAG: type II secretion system secretin GspD [Thermaurantiacus sp.]